MKQRRRKSKKKKRLKKKKEKKEIDLVYQWLLEMEELEEEQHHGNLPVDSPVQGDKSLRKKANQRMREGQAGKPHKEVGVIDLVSQPDVDHEDLRPLWQRFCNISNDEVGFSSVFN